MKINFTGVSAGPKKQGCGIADVTIKEVAFGQSKQKKTPYVEITTESEAGATHTEQFYLSQKALPKLRHLLEDGLGCDASQLEREISEDQITALLKDKNVRLKFSGEEYLRKDQTWGIKTVLGFGSFAESIKVPKDRTSLTFSEARDIKKTATTTAEEMPF